MNVKNGWKDWRKQYVAMQIVPAFGTIKVATIYPIIKEI